MRHFTCVQCGKEAVLTDSEIQFYKEKNLQLPKRCEECRKKNKEAKGQQPKRSANSNQAVNSPLTSERAENRGSNGRNGSNGSNGRKPKSPLGILLMLLVVAALAIGGKVCNIDFFGGSFSSDNQNVTDQNVKDQNVKDQNEDSSMVENDTSDDASNADTNEDKEVREQKKELPYSFRNESYLSQHFIKHGAEFPYDNEQQYLEGANAVIEDKDALHKTEAEDRDDVYYLEETNEFVIVSTDGYIRTYFKPDDGKAYFDRQ